MHEDGVSFGSCPTAPLALGTCSFSLSDVSQLPWVTFLQNLVLSHFPIIDGFENVTAKSPHP